MNSYLVEIKPDDGNGKNGVSVRDKTGRTLTLATGAAQTMDGTHRALYYVIERLATLERELDMAHANEQALEAQLNEIAKDRQQNDEKSEGDSNQSGVSGNGDQ